VITVPLPNKRTSPAVGTGPVPKNTVADEALGVDFIITLNAPDPYCGRCGGVSGPEGAWCDNCIQECREYTLLLDLKREAA
jgi:hypothetical protein